MLPSPQSAHPLASIPASPSPSPTTPRPAPLLVLGSAALDITARASSPLAHTTSPGAITISPGGVARNIAEAACRLGADVCLVSARGDDDFGALLDASSTERRLINRALLDVPHASTAICNNFVDADGSLVGGVADMSVIEQIDEDEVRSFVCSVKDVDSGRHRPWMSFLAALSRWSPSTATSQPH